MVFQITAETAVTVPANFITSPGVVLTSMTFNTTVGTKEITDLTLSGIFNTELSSSKFYAVVSTVAYATTPLDAVAVKDATATSKKNTFLLTLNTLPSGERNLKFLNSAGNADDIDFDDIDSSAPNFYIYVMREDYNSAPSLDNTKFSKHYIPIVITDDEISVGNATAVESTSVTLGSKTYTVEAEESIVEKTFEDNLNVSYYVKINSDNEIIEVLDVIKITAEAGSKKSLAKDTVADLTAQLQALQSQIQGLQAPLGGGFTFNTNLTVGSKGADVIALQTLLIAKGFTIPAGATGYFGTLTQAAVQKFQTANGITPAAGYFGPITRAKVNSESSGSVTTGAGCTSTGGFSPLTGLPCTSGGTFALPPGCTSASGFSATTGQSCTLQSTMPAPTPGTTPGATPVSMSLSSNSTVYVNGSIIDDWIDEVRVEADVGDDVDDAFDNNFNKFDVVTFTITNQNHYFNQFKNIVDEDNIVDIAIRVVIDSNSDIIININRVRSTDTDGVTYTSVNDAKILAMKKLLIGLKYDNTKSPFNT